MKKIVVTGASGNIGSAVLRELSSGGAYEVLALARRRPSVPPQSVHTAVSWRTADVSSDELASLFRGADAVIHAAWKMQPSHRPEVTWETNAVGTRRVLEAVSQAQVPAVVCLSSIAAYSPVHHDEPTDESWATDGTSSAYYCREKAYVERLLDTFEEANPQTRTVRMRPTFVFQRSAASEQRRIFGGPLARPSLLDRRFIPVIPVPAGLRFQAVHAGDVARAIEAVVRLPVRGAFNLAGDGVIRRDELGELMSARTVAVPPRLSRRAMDVAWRAHALGVPGSLLDALMRVPVLSTDRARTELAWTPQHTGMEALEALLQGIPERAGSTMPPLHP